MAREIKQQSGLTGGRVIRQQGAGGGSAPAKKTAEHHGILHNLLTEIADTARGIGPGLWAMGKAVAHDTKDAVDGGGHNFQLDDIGRAIGANYAKRYGMLAHGDVKGFLQQINDHPLSFILDFTGAGGGLGGIVGKVGEAAAISGAAAREGSLAAKAARAAGFVERGAEDAQGVSNLERAARAYGATSKEVRQGARSGLVRKVRAVGEDAAVEGRIGKPLYREAKRNPVLRRRDEIVDRVLEHPRLDRVKVVGLQSRVGKQLAKAPRLAADVRRADVQPAIKAVRKLNEPELVAWGVLHEGYDAGKYLDTMKHVLENDTHISDLDREMLKTRIAKLEDADVQRLIAEPSPRLQHAVEVTQDLANDKMGSLLQEVSGMDERALLSRRLLPQRITEGAYRNDLGEIVDRETRRSFNDLDTEAPIEELRAAAEGTAYRPHLAPRDSFRNGFGSAKAYGRVRREPRLASNLTHASTGRRFETGVYEDAPHALFQQSRNIVRGKLAKDLYDTGVNELGVNFDKAHFLETGGSKHWVIADKNGIRSLASRLERYEGVFDELKDLLPEDKVSELVRDLRTSADTLASKASEHGDEGLVMIPRQAYEKLTESLNQSGALAKNIIDKPLDVFRQAVLFTRPAYYVNNIVSQHLLLAIRDNGVSFLPKYISFLTQKNMQGARDLFRLGATDPASTAKLWDAVFEKHAPGLRNASVGQAEMGHEGSFTERLAMSGQRKKQAFASMLRAPHTANELGAVLSDDLPRQFRFIRLMEPHIKAAIADGERGSAPEIAMRMLDQDPVLRDRITEQTLHDLVDFRGLSDVERKVLRRIIPFYGWLRGITTWTAELGYNHPMQLLELAEVGKVGNAENAEWNANTPDWLHGAIRIGGAKDGKQKTIGTQGLNPLATLADVADLAQGALGDRPGASIAGGTTVGQINPYARALLQAAFNKGRDFSTGMPMLMPGQNMANDNQQYPGWIASAAGGYVGSLPIPMLISQIRTARTNQALTGQPSSPSAVYSSPYSEYLRNFLTGVPLRTVNLQGAANRAAEDARTRSGEGGAFG